MKLDLRYLISRANVLWNSGNARIDRHNRRAWIRSIMILGDKWVLVKPVSKVTK